MMATVPAYDPSAPLPVAQDFYAMRREGIGRIAQACGDVWTDYNTHDPGVTLLEAFAYAITELAYRADFPIEDLLASAAAAAGDATSADPYPDQAFPTARHILTVDPVTPTDLRRLLIDVPTVRNGWVDCDGCRCVTSYSAWCESGEVVLSYDPSLRRDPSTTVRTVRPRGLYRVLLELESHTELGDLNDRKVVRRRSFPTADGRRHTLTIELRFPEFGAAHEGDRARVRDAASVTSVVANGSNGLRADATPADIAEFRGHWHDVYSVDFDITLVGGSAVHVGNASLRVFGDRALREAVDPEMLVEWLQETDDDSAVDVWRRKLKHTETATAAARKTLEAHRSLDEDWCCIGLVGIVDIAVCAEVEVAATTDIERVQAHIWHRVERYLDPPVDFASLDELRSRGVASEDIFDGPELDSGFLTDDVLRATDRRHQLRVSDILDGLMEIEGVIAISGLRLTAYDDTGRSIGGISDPDLSSGTARFDVTRTSALWLMRLAADHRARLHRGLSSVSFTSGGLPFVPRLDEAEDTLVQLRGEAARPKLPASELDLPTPMGRVRKVEAYRPVQHSLPAIYGIGPAGLPSTATAQRAAQAAQLKAYLMVFEQLLRNGYAQLAHTADLFSLYGRINHTYFTGSLEHVGIVGYGEVVNTDALTLERLSELVETPEEFLRRRNALLDHLLARFGESFAEYGLVLTDLHGHTRVGADLVTDKLAFLRALPRLGHDRGKAFNRRISPRDPDNASGLRQRMNLLLGLPDWTIVYRASAAPAGFAHTLTIDELDETVVTLVVPGDVDVALQSLIAELWPTGAPPRWSIRSGDGQLTLTTIADGTASDRKLLGPDAGSAAAALGARLVDLRRQLLAELVVPGQQHATPGADDSWVVTLEDGDGAEIGSTDQHFDTRGSAEGFIAMLATWAAQQRSVVVEHLLLRPKFPGDALYPACSGGGGCGCDDGVDDDPYSFRLTYVMPGWGEPFSSSARMRGYVDRTVQEHTPSHLIVKICWVGNDAARPDPCDPVEHERQFEQFENAWSAWAEADAAVDWSVEHPDAITRDLLGAAVPDADDAAVCACADEMLGQFGRAFRVWMDTGLAAGTPLAKFPPFDPPVLSCSLAPADAAEAVRSVLLEWYTTYTEVSYRLSLLLKVLGELSNTYPRATLHDCDEGSDANPVRLGHTAIGGN